MASRWALSTAATRVSGDSTTLIPFPPPPADALTKTGYPIAFAASFMSVSGLISIEGSIGTPALSNISFAESLSPMA